MHLGIVSMSHIQSRRHVELSGPLTFSYSMCTCCEFINPDLMLRGGKSVIAFMPLVTALAPYEKFWCDLVLPSLAEIPFTVRKNRLAL